MHVQTSQCRMLHAQADKVFHVEHISTFLNSPTQNLIVFHVEHSRDTPRAECSTWNISVQSQAIFIRKSLWLQQYVLVITLH
jgi:hypothetical protein